MEHTTEEKRTALFVIMDSALQDIKKCVGMAAIMGEYPAVLSLVEAHESTLKAIIGLTRD